MVDRKMPTRSFYDLEVYQSTYKASIIILTRIVPKLPAGEKYDLAQQIRRSAKAVPRLIAEAYSKKHQAKGYDSLLDTAIEESNETIVSLSHVKDGYGIESQLCSELVAIYEKASRQLYKLSLAWSHFTEKRLRGGKTSCDPTKNQTKT